MKDKAIELMEKEKEIYLAQIRHISNTLNGKNRTVINHIMLKLKKEVEIRNYIIKILEDQ